MMRVIGDYVLTTNDQLSVYVARFLSLFLASNPLLEPHEIDNFILQNSDVLSNWCIAPGSCTHNSDFW